MKKEKKEIYYVVLKNVYLLDRSLEWRGYMAGVCLLFALVNNIF